MAEKNPPPTPDTPLQKWQADIAARLKSLNALVTKWEAKPLPTQPDKLIAHMTAMPHWGLDHTGPVEIQVEGLDAPCGGELPPSILPATRVPLIVPEFTAQRYYDHGWRIIDHNGKTLPPRPEEEVSNG